MIKHHFTNEQARQFGEEFGIDWEWSRSSGENVSVASALVFTSPLFASETDDRIESSARGTYVFKTYLKDDAIQLHFKDGQVTLSGTVVDASHRSLAGDTVAGLPGVTAVDNRLTEDGQAPVAKSDAWLIAKVKTTLLFHANVNASATEVAAKNGVVTLRGPAASLAQKDLTAEYARNVEASRRLSMK